MEKNLPVPYKSQHDSDSKGSNNDCGAASEAMVFEFWGVKSSTGDILAALGNPTGFINWEQLARVAHQLGFDTQLLSNQTFDNLKGLLDQGIPVLVVGGYGNLVSTQEKTLPGGGFKGSHIMVVVGYRPDNSVYVNDPDFWGALEQQGDHHVYTFQEFTSFWQNAGNAEGNLPNTLFIVNPNIKTATSPADVIPDEVTVTVDKGVNVRNSTSIQPGNIVKVFPKGTIFKYVSIEAGQEISGNDHWYKVFEEVNPEVEFYVWSGGVAITSIKPAAKEEAPVSPTPTPPAPTQNTDSDYLKGIISIYQLSKSILEANNALPADQQSTGFWQKIKGLLKWN